MEWLFDGNKNDVDICDLPTSLEHQFKRFENVKMELVFGIGKKNGGHKKGSTQ